MNLVCIPYHDWRKIEKEGARTRDSHLINHFTNSKNINKVLVVNRPTSYPEILRGRKAFKIKGKVILSKGNLKLYKISDKLYVLDYITLDLLSPLIEKKLWFFKSFGYARLIGFYRECLKFLKMESNFIFTNNIFSLNFVNKLGTDSIIFDAYDNLIFFPNNHPIKSELIMWYNKFKEIAKFWITNSTKNLNYYKENYNQDKCYLVKNGVDVDVFESKYDKPSDMANINGPIIGFGGKITHLFDTDLFNYCVENHKDKAFVIIGQVLDKEVFNKIKPASNVYYLGDKHYSEYPGYVCHFDVGIVPYVTSHLESGVDSIKVYEYIAAGLNTVGTQGGGMPDLSDYLFVSSDKFEFSNNIAKAVNNKMSIKLPIEHTWAFKCENILEHIGANFVKVI